MSALAPGRRGMTLFEVSAYIAFTAVLVAPMLRMEVVARRATAEQTALLVLDREWARISDALGSDLRSAMSVRAEDEGKSLRIVRATGGGGEMILYRLDPAAPGRLLRDIANAASDRDRILSPHAQSVSFRREGASWVADVRLSNVVQQRTIERTGRIVRTPRAEAPAAERRSP
ncbi:MAG: hypothetical protein AAB215_08400 [Planctomycetota bacterium]